MKAILQERLRAMLQGGGDLEGHDWEREPVPDPHLRIKPCVVEREAKGEEAKLKVAAEGGGQDKAKGDGWMKVRGVLESSDNIISEANYTHNTHNTRTQTTIAGVPRLRRGEGGDKRLATMAAPVVDLRRRRAALVHVALDVVLHIRVFSLRRAR